MKIIAGLGNPGRKYQRTRHNIGFDVIAEMNRQLGSSAIRTRFEAETAEFSHGGENLLLLCPQTYMNASGGSVRAALDFYKLEPTDLLVICDDLNLETGRIRIRPGGSAGGQKGMADIIRHLGTDDFSRLRIGIDRPPEGYEVVDYVLGKFNPHEMKTIELTVIDAAAAALMWCKSGTAETMNRYNASPRK